MRAARTTDAALRSFAAKKKEKEKIAKKNQLVSRICDALGSLKDLDEKNKERFECIQHSTSHPRMSRMRRENREEPSARGQVNKK